MIEFANLLKRGLSMSLEKIYYSIRETARETGLSQKYVRAGVNNGSIPAIKSGNKNLINLPMLLKQLDEASKKGMND